jgi:hypothetical protein
MINYKNYKYSVTKDEETKYFVGQKEIEIYTGLKRTAIYFMLNNPEKRKKTFGFEIKKLTNLLPVYKICSNDDNEITYTKIDYNLIS